MGKIEKLRNLSEYLTVSEAANFLGISPSTLRNWDKDGKLKPYRHPVNGYRLYREKDLTEILRNLTKNGK